MLSNLPKIKYFDFVATVYKTNEDQRMVHPNLSLFYPRNKYQMIFIATVSFQHQVIPKLKIKKFA